MKGKVYLVGAGPGDPDLLTVKAIRVLKRADAVLYDDLVSAAILDLVSSSALLQSVGKRCGMKKVTQAEINRRIVELAQLGLEVVRLKCGDPLVFGRAGEEMEALRRAGIEFEIVPGITAALAAASAAQIPLTHRRASSALVFLTGHYADSAHEEDWNKLVASGATMVIYMPGKDYAAMADRLVKAGLSCATACAIVSRAGTAQQQIQLTNVAGLRVLRPLAAPCLLLVGAVVDCAHDPDFASRETAGMLAMNLESQIQGERVS